MASVEFDQKIEVAVFGVEIAARRRAEKVEPPHDLKESLEALFGRPADLVEAAAIRNPYLKASIDASREPLFEG